MRKLYTFITTLVLSVITLTANAFNVTINVDNPERVKISVNYETKEIVAGNNTFDIEAYNPIAIEANVGAMIKSVVRTSDGYQEYISNMKSCYIYPDADKEGEIWEITSVMEDELRTASCRVKVDDASKVRVQLTGTYTDITLNDGWNDIYYIPEVETQLMIASTDYSKLLYEVRQNGTKVDAQYSTWYVTLQQGDEIEILANYPDIDIPVHFVFADEDSKGFITEVTVNDEPVQNYDAEDFTVKAGSKLKISGNTNIWNVDEFIVNGNMVNFYDPYSISVTEEMTFNIKAHKYGTITAYIDIDNPNNVRIYRGYSYYNDQITGLVSGINTVELSETNSMISIMAESGCYIHSVTDNNQSQYYQDYNNSFNVTMSDGMTLTIISGSITRDQEAIVYIDDRSAAAQYFNFARSDRSEMEVTTGYNRVNFYSGDNPMNLSWYGAPCANVYLNDVIINPQYEGSTSYQFGLSHGDILKIYLASNPKTCNVDFDVKENVGAVAVTKDLVRTIENWQNGFTTLQGTQVDVKADNEDNIKITVNDEELTPTDGIYTFVVAKNTIVKIENGNDNGISNISADDTSIRTLYNMQGTKVTNGIDEKRISDLPAGIYIINGKKIQVR